jgi:hypothetical protein
MIARAALRPTRIRGRRPRRSTASSFVRPAFLAMRVAPLAVQIVVATVLLVTIWAAVDWMVQVARKPAELFVAVSGSLAKVPAQTWQQYGPLFDEHSTAVITPELLAALAQVESSGNPVARTYWRWRFGWNPFELYRPASSALGVFQITDEAFAEARRYCIHNHIVVEDGAWYGPHSCWFNALYTRCVAGSCCGNDRRDAGSRGRTHARSQPHHDRLIAAAAKPRGDHPPVRGQRR